MGSHKLLTMNITAFYQWQFECTGAYSPDMSPIEHVWHALDQRVRQRVPVPANIQQLRTAIEEDLDNIPQATINSLINSM